MSDREWVRFDRRAENTGIRKEEDELRLDSWIQIRLTGWDEKKWSSSVLLARRPPAFHWRTLRESGRKEETGGVEGQPGARGGGKGAEGEDTKWADGGIRGLKAMVGRQCCIRREGPKLNSGCIEAREVRGGSNSVTSRDAAGETAPGVKAAESSEFGKGE